MECDRVYTCIGLDRMAKNEYTVYRRYRDFRALHERLSDRYDSSCMILPPPPPKSGVKSVSVKMKGEDDSDGLGRTIGKLRRVTLGPEFTGAIASQ